MDLTALDKVQNTAVMTILPVYRTKLVRALLRESGLSLVEIDLDKTPKRSSILTRRLDNRHPFYRQGYESRQLEYLLAFDCYLSQTLPSEQINSQFTQL